MKNYCHELSDNDPLFRFGIFHEKNEVRKFFRAGQVPSCCVSKYSKVQLGPWLTTTIKCAVAYYSLVHQYTLTTIKHHRSWDFYSASQYFQSPFLAL